MKSRPTAPDAADLAKRLEAVLTELALAHESLLELVREHRRAISRSDAAAIQENLTRQGVLGVRVAELEGFRAEITAALAGKAGFAIAELTQFIPAETRPGIDAAAQRLRIVLSAIQRENGVIRAATHTLLSHIDGLMQQVARALSHAGTYGRQGRIEGTGPIPCGIDMLH